MKSPSPVVLSHQNSVIYLFSTAFTYKKCSVCAFFSLDSDDITFSLEKAILWIAILWTHILPGSNGLKLKMQKSCGLFDYLTFFNSCLDSHSDGTHSLQRIHWWAGDVILYFSKSVLMKKRTHLHLGWPEGESISVNFHFWVNYSFNWIVSIMLTHWMINQHIARKSTTVLI